MSDLADRLIATHDALAAARIPHAYGGAIALAYCTEEPRGTRDLDINVFVRAERAAEVLGSLPGAVRVSPADVASARRDDQVRVWWDDTPLDLFFSAHPFHDEVAASVRMVPFEGRTIPILSCSSLVVFKALYNRTRDWGDIESILQAGSANCDESLSWLERLAGVADARTLRLTNLCG